MTHAWKQTIEINEDIARTVIAMQHRIPIDTIQLLDAGWDNLVYLVNQDLIFRFPRRELGLECMENEIIFLPYIQQLVSFPLSAPVWIGEPSSIYPYLYAGYRMLQGKVLSDCKPRLLDDMQFARTIATWLRELHQVPVKSEHLSSMKGGHEWKLNVEHRTKRSKENLESYEQYFIQAGFDREKLLKTIHFVAQWNFSSQKICFVHGDLYARHIVVDDALKPAGIIDWGDIHIGHPGIDLSIGMIFMPEMFLEFLSFYGAVDEETYRILLFNSFCHSMSFLPYAFEQNKENLMRWAACVLGRVIEALGLLFNV